MDKMIPRRKEKGLEFIAGEWPPRPDLPTLVFIHGAGGSAEFWAGQVEALKEEVNTIAVDLPGHGPSGGPGRTRVEDYADAVGKFIRGLSLPRPVPVGLSMGGATTQMLLLRHGDLFDRAVLVSTGARLRVVPQIFETIEKNFPGFVELMEKFAVSPHTPKDRVKPIMEDTMRRDPEVVYGDFQACDAFDVMELLPRIKAEVLVMTAADDLLTPPKYGEFLADKIPKARRVHFEKAGHMLPAEKPDEFNRALLAFIKETQPGE